MSRHHKAYFKIRKKSKVSDSFSNNTNNSGNGSFHQQFALRATFNNPNTNPLIIYIANNFNDNTANPVDDTSNGDTIFPTGTVIAKNLSDTAFTFSVFGKEADVKTLVVPPDSEAAITTDAIREVIAYSPGITIKAKFIFDIFLPTDPVLPE